MFFLKAYYKIKLVLYIHAQMVFKYFACLVQEKIKMKFLLASVKTLLNLEIVPKATLNFCSGFPFSLTGRFFPLYIRSRLRTTKPAGFRNNI
jgi:hypothetical protein